jgi:hypothetical protein
LERFAVRGDFLKELMGTIQRRVLFVTWFSIFGPPL